MYLISGKLFLVKDEDHSFCEGEEENDKMTEQERYRLEKRIGPEVSLIPVRKNTIRVKMFSKLARKPIPDLSHYSMQRITQRPSRETVSRIFFILIKVSITTMV